MVIIINILKAKEFKELVESNPPYNATVKYDLIDAGNGKIYKKIIYI